MGYRQTTLERLAQNDKLAMFRIRGGPDRLWGNETTIFLNDEVSSSRVDDSQSEVEEKRNLPKAQFSSKSCSET
jgi:hypothetical protein